MNFSNQLPTKFRLSCLTSFPNLVSFARFTERCLILPATPLALRRARLFNARLPRFRRFRGIIATPSFTRRCSCILVIARWLIISLAASILFTFCSPLSFLAFSLHLSVHSLYPVSLSGAFDTHTRASSSLEPAFRWRRPFVAPTRWRGATTLADPKDKQHLIWNISFLNF